MIASNTVYKVTKYLTKTKTRDEKVIDIFIGNVREIKQHFHITASILYRNRGTTNPHSPYQVEKVSNKIRYYSLYDYETNEPIYLHKTIPELVELLHCHPRSIYHYKNGKSKKYILR